MNPAAKIGRFLRDAGDPRSRIDPFTVEEEASFLDTAQRHFPRQYPMLLCALRTGLRFGELTGLQWGDLDFKRPLHRRSPEPSRRRANRAAQEQEDSSRRHVPPARGGAS